MTFDWRNPIDSCKVFKIHGWGANPLVRYGIEWMKFSQQTRAFVSAVRGFEVGEKKCLPFRTMDGDKNYTLERVK